MERTTGWRRHTLSVLVGSLSEAGMAMSPGRLNGDRSCRAFRKLIRTPPEVGSFDAPPPLLFQDILGRFSLCRFCVVSVVFG
jgi:hypothetical protein